MLNEEKIVKALTSFGLSQREQIIYLNSLEKGSCLLIELANLTGIKRTTLGEIMPNLIKRGIILQTIKGKRIYYYARDPRDLISQLKDRVIEAMKFLPELLSIRHSSEVDPNIYYFDGLDGIKQIYKKILEIGQPIYAFLQVDNYDQNIKNWLEKEFIPIKINKKIRTQNIISSQNAKSILETNLYRENRYIDADDFPFQIEVLTFGDFVSLVHYRRSDKPSAILVQSLAAAETIKSIHQFIWKKLDQNKVDNS